MTNSNGLRDALARGERTCSFEFFPSKNGTFDATLWQTLRELEQYKPTFVSVTYGAGGSTQERTFELARSIQNETGMCVVGHLTCVGSSKDDLRHVISRYAADGVRNILALRGDPATGPNTEWVQHPGGLKHAVELVELIKDLGDFTVGVAAFPEGHPESTSIEQDAQVLAMKQRAGADYALTQLFFRPLDYFELVDRAAAAGATLPIIPGIMPVTNVSQIERFAALSGADFPAPLAERFHALGDDSEGVLTLGVEVAAEMCQQLLDAGAPGLHFYTLNRSRSTIEVYEALGLDALTG